MIVNAVCAARPTRTGPFGGGALSEATVEDFRGWTGAVAEQAFVFLSEGIRAGAGTLIQVTGGCGAAGDARARAVGGGRRRHARARARRGAGVARRRDPRRAADRRRHDRLAEDGGDDRGTAENETADQAEIARAVEYLAGQSPRAFTHELVVTPAGDRWVP